VGRLLGGSRCAGLVPVDDRNPARLHLGGIATRIEAALNEEKVVLDDTSRAT
jgi:hypothetical protein